MARKPVIGQCHLCGVTTKLSFEHVPPRAAFNNRPLVYAHIEEILKTNDLDKVSGEIKQRGAGGYTLCERCNNNTGHWYGNAFVEWAYQGMEIICGTQTPTLEYPFCIFPLRVIKQVVCMLFSVCHPQFQSAQPALAKFVLDRDAKYLPDHIWIYAFYTLAPKMRSAGVTALMNTKNSDVYAVSELTFPPFGFLMTLDTPSTDHRLYDISGFSRYGYNDYCAPLFMKLPVMPIYTPYPTDYRSREEVLRDMHRQPIQPMPKNGMRL